MFRILLIFAGGGFGSVLRYLIQGLGQRLIATPFPIGTFIVNVTGCFVIGLLGGLFYGPRPINEDYRFAIMTGILGGYTTFSAFGWESMQLSGDRQFILASVNVVASVLAGLFAVWLGKTIINVAYGN